jgi:SNF2 family DNA or RNA helicase
MPPKLTLYRHALRLRSATEPPVSTGVVTFRRGIGSSPICVDIAERLVQHYGTDLTIADDALAALRDQRAALDSRLAAQEAQGPTLSSLATDLWPHQKRAASWLVCSRRGILADEQGMGKTASALQATLGYRSMVVVCANVKKDDWAVEIERWTHDNCFVVEGDAEQRQKIIYEWMCTGGYLVCNYDQIVMHTIEAEAWILDEAHKVRNRKSHWWKALRKMTKSAASVIALTANPSINSPQEIWSLLALCDPDRFRSYWSFVYRFFEISTNGFGIKIGGVRRGEEASLDDLVRPYLMRRERSEVGGLGVPPVRRGIVRHKMVGMQELMYRTLAATGSVSYGESTVETWMALQKITRLRQLAIDPKILFPDYDGPSKIDTLLDVVTSESLDLQNGVTGASQRPTLIFTMLESAAEIVRDRLMDRGITAVLLTGGTSLVHRSEALDAFAGGGATVLVSTHGTGGEGLNLPTASRVIYLELAWHPAGNKQAQDRAVRPGQASADVEVIVVHTADSVEDHILDIIREKRRVTWQEIARRETTA